MSIGVLLVEPDPDASRSITLALDRMGFRVTAVASAEDALYEYAHRDIDLVVTATVLAGMNGVELCRLLKERSSVAVVVVDPWASVGSTVDALDAGADDVVVANRLDELVARIRALLRRRRGSLRPRRQVRVGELVAEWTPSGRLCSVDHRFSLSPVEGTVLEVLAERSGCVVPLEVLRERLTECHGAVPAAVVDAALRRLGGMLALAGAASALQHLPGGGWLLAS
jgi:DNA-binding response OmpR family regulator